MWSVWSEFGKNVQDQSLRVAAGLVAFPTIKRSNFFNPLIIIAYECESPIGKNQDEAGIKGLLLP